MHSENRRMELRIRGRVQGVGFRWSVRERAQRLGLAGWVRNEADGSVTVVAEGQHGSLEALRRWCDDGPPMARVEMVQVQWLAPRGDCLLPFGVKS